MAVPKKKISKSQSHTRHSARQGKKIQYRINKIKLVWSKEANQNKLAHTVCPTTGYYKGKQVLNIKSKSKSTIVDAD